MLGDFNIHWNIATDSNTVKLNDILGSFWHVRLPTHTNGNMLDSVSSRDVANLVGNVTVNDMISDRAIVDIKLAISKPGLLEKKMTYRKYRAIDIR